MDAMEAILTRRSIRKYRTDPVPDKLIDELLKAAMSAPSAMNERTWHFVVITERKILDEIPQVHPYAQMLFMAPGAIAVCCDLQLQRAKNWWIQDCSAATENILIAAQANDLGACWLGVYPREERIKEIQRILGLPQHVIPLCLVAIGYPAEKKTPSDRYEPSRVHYNQW